VGWIEVDALGLAMLADHCEQHGARIAATEVPSVVGGGFEPSVAAVNAAHADVAAAGSWLAARMQATATAASAAAVEYVDTETSARDAISAIGVTVR
jgi:hypothetical protein